MNILKVLTDKKELGNLGEDAACRYLKKNGYKITKRNYVANGHEIDIIAENKDYICFVEVKTRTLSEENSIEARPASAVTPEKQRSIISAARFYLGGFFDPRMARFDVAEVYTKNGRVEDIYYIENAFNYNTASKDAWRRKRSKR